MGDKRRFYYFIYFFVCFVCLFQAEPCGCPVEDYSVARLLHKTSFLTCMESALIISPRNRFPISMASLDLPVPVAPRTTTRDGTTALLTATCTLRADAAMMPLAPAGQLTGGTHAQRGRSGARGWPCCPATGPPSLWIGNVATAGL